MNMRSFITVFWVMVMAGNAWADTDYRCLNDCMHQGKTASVCMPQCTYNQQLPLQKTNPPNPLNQPGVESTAKQFVAPTPVDNNQLLLPPAHRDVALPHSRDYTCVAQCRKRGYQYQLCDEQCVITSEATADKLKKKFSDDPAPSAIEPLKQQLP